MTEQIADQLRALRDEVAALKAQYAAPKLMTTSQCAELLQMTTRRLEEMRKRRNLGDDLGPPFLHLSSKKVLYDRDEVLAWARSHRV